MFKPTLYDTRSHGALTRWQGQGQQRSSWLCMYCFITFKIIGCLFNVVVLLKTSTWWMTSPVETSHWSRTLCFFFASYKIYVDFIVELSQVETELPRSLVEIRSKKSYLFFRKNSFGSYFSGKIKFDPKLQAGSWTIDMIEDVPNDCHYISIKMEVESKILQPQWWIQLSDTF